MTRALTITALMLVSWVGGYRWGYAVPVHVEQLRGTL
jgi:hypothetical protein